MSHAEYLFHMYIDPEETNPIQDAVSQFESYADDVGDENNWHQEEVLIMRFPDGTESIHQLAKDDDWRGRNELYAQLVAEEHKSYYDWAVQFAKDCIVSEIESQYSYATGIYNEPLPFSWDTASEDIGKMIQAVAQQLVKHPDAPGQYTYALHRLTGIMDEIRYSNPCPFTTEYPDFYEYRCFDLSHGEDKPEGYIEAILIADIHT